jgi:hypothetical protein
LGAVASANVAQGASFIDFTAAPQKGTGTSITTAGDSFISPTAYNGKFDAGNWVFNFVMRTGAATCGGRMRCIVWAGPNADGSGARKLTSTTLLGSNVTMSSTTTDYNTSVTWAAPSITLNNEYLFFEVEWNLTVGAGTSNSCSALFRVGASNIATANFVAAVSGPGVLASGVADIEGFGQAVSGVSGTGVLQAVEASGRANYMLWSEDFSQWPQQQNTQVAVNTGVQDPAGGYTADQIIELNANSVARLIAQTVNLPSNGTRSLPTSCNGN